MSDATLLFRPATELASLLRAGEVTSVQVVEAHLGQIRRWNPQLHAVVSVREAEALREAESADRARREGRPMGPLHGVPITLKDSLRVRGVRSTFGGMPPYARYLPRTDCQVAARLREAGAIVVGRTNLPLMALDWQCNNPFFAEGVNPWDLTRTPGGSSGGAAAALAAGFTPLELGSDLGGSIRYPAHCCGVLGLRTTVGLLPIGDTGPEGMPLPFHRLLALGPMARTLGDLALMLDVLTGPAAPRPGPGTSHLQAEQLRIAVLPSLPGAEPSPATTALLDSVCAGLRADRHQVDVGVAPDVDLERAWRVWGAIAGYELWSGVPRLLDNRATRYLFQSYMLRHKLGDGPFTRWFSAGMASTRRDYEAALAEQAEILQVVDAFFQRYALWLLPVSMGEAIPLQRRGSPIDVGGRAVPYSVYLGAYTVPTTAFETPVLTMPIGFGPTGMPIGIQVHGPRFSDRQLLDTAERALSRHLTVRIPPALAGASA
jgi:amidase